MTPHELRVKARENRARAEIELRDAECRFIAREIDIFRCVTVYYRYMMAVMAHLAALRNEIMAQPEAGTISLTQPLYEAVYPGQTSRN